MYRDLFIVEDAAADERFSSNPLVTSEPKIRFYAGAPLITPNNLALGALCVIDRVSRKLTEEQSDALRALSRQVMAELEVRRTGLELKRELMEQRLATRSLDKAFRAAEASHRSQKRLLRKVTHRVRAAAQRIVSIMDRAWMGDLPRNKKPDLVRIRSSAGSVLKCAGEIASLAEFEKYQPGALKVRPAR